MQSIVIWKMDILLKNFEESEIVVAPLQSIAEGLQKFFWKYNHHFSLKGRFESRVKTTS